MNCEANPFSIFSYLWSNHCIEIFGMLQSASWISGAMYFQLFMATLILEAPIYSLLLFRTLSAKKLSLAIVLLNLSTHPIVCFLIPSLAHQLGWSVGKTEILSELFAPIIELLILHLVFNVSLRLSMLSAILANLFSWLLGSYLVNAYYN